MSLNIAKFTNNACVKFILVLGVVLLTSESTYSSAYNTPQGALSALEAAYMNKDIEAAVAAKDFFAEARQMLGNLVVKAGEDGQPISEDVETLNTTAEVLELSFRKDIQENGFPDFSGIQCESVIHQTIAEDLVILRETCQFQDGGSSVQDLYAARSSGGWRIAGVLEE
jgi:hypothetical protein